MAIVNNIAKTSVPAYVAGDMRFVDYSVGDTNLLDPHLNTVNTGCGTEIIGGFPASDDRSTPTVTVDFYDGVVFVGTIPDQAATIGEPFYLDTSFYFTTDGSGGNVYTSTPLNTGLVLDAETGIISGATTGLGNNNPIITCTNGAATADSNAFEIAST